MNRLRAAAGLILVGLFAGIFGACSDDADDGANADVVTEVVVGSDSIVLLDGKRDTLEARALNSRGDVVGSAPIAWTSTNPGVVAIVDNNVALTASIGTAYAVATAGGFSDSTKIVVAQDTSLPPAITVYVVAPVENQFIGDSLNLNLLIASKNTLSALRLVIGPTTIPLDISKLVLAGGGGTYRWNNRIALTGVPSGNFPMSVTATDVRNSVGSSTISVRHDIPPKINVSVPINDYDVFSGPIPLRITCVDAEKSSCAELTVNFSGIGATGALIDRRVATGTSLIDVSVPIADWGVTSLTVQISAKDSSTQATSLERKILVANNPSLQRITTVPGFAIDVDGARVLYSMRPDSGALILRSAAGVDETIFDSFKLKIWAGYLMPFGALFLFSDNNAPISPLLREYRNGNLIALNGTTARLVANGPFAAWTYPPSSPLTFRDFTAGVQRTAVIGALQSFHVSANGHIVYSLSADGPFLPPNGNQITFDSTDISRDVSATHLFPKTDGVKVVYTKRTVAPSGPNTFTILWSATRQDTLAALRVTPATGNYDIADGWVAYQKPDATGALQVWTRSPGGTEKQVTFFAANSTVELIGPDGAVVFNNQGARYVARPPYAMLTTLGDLTPKVVLRNGEFLFLFGGSVFKLN